MVGWLHQVSLINLRAHQHYEEDWRQWKRLSVRKLDASLINHNLAKLQLSEVDVPQRESSPSMYITTAHENSTPFPPPRAASILLARSALRLLRLLSKLLRSVPVPMSVPPAAVPGLFTAPLPAGPVACERTCEECPGGTGGRLSSESLLTPEFDMAGGGGTFVMGCWLEARTCPPPPCLLYLLRSSCSTPELRLELRRNFLSPRFRAARSAAASSSLRRRRVT